jgi:hypothetical protein
MRSLSPHLSYRFDHLANKSPCAVEVERDWS